MGRVDSVEVDGVVMTYERAGRGDPVVLVHGYVGDGPSTWRPQLVGLADEFDVIALHDHGSVTLPALLQDIRLLDLLEIPNLESRSKLYVYYLVKRYLGNCTTRENGKRILHFSQDMGVGVYEFTGAYGPHPLVGVLGAAYRAPRR